MFAIYLLDMLANFLFHINGYVIYYICSTSAGMQSYSNVNTIYFGNSTKPK